MCDRTVGSVTFPIVAAEVVSPRPRGRTSAIVRFCTTGLYLAAVFFALVQPTPAVAQVARTIETEVAWTWHLFAYNVLGIPDTWSPTREALSALIDQRKAALDAQGECADYPPPGIGVLYKIIGNLRPAPDSYVVNGTPTSWQFDYKATYCYTGQTLYNSGSILAYTRCPQQGNLISWYGKTDTFNTTPYSFFQWCEGINYSLEQQTCPAVANTASDGAGNVVYPSTGLKAQTEVDFQSADGALEFVRHYDSGRGVFASLLTTRIIDRSTTTPPVGCYPDRVAPAAGFSWPHCFSYFNKQPTNSYQVFTSTGRHIGFSGAPGAITARRDINDRLERLTSGEGVVTWRLISENNIAEIYNASGFLMGREWSDGRKLTVIYSDLSTPLSVAPGPGFQIKHVDGFGRELNFRYDAYGNLQKLIDPAGRETFYTHEPFLTDGCAGGNCYRLKSVQYPDGTTKQYHYNEPALVQVSHPFRMTGITDERGIRIGTYAYDANGRVVSVQGAGGVGSSTLQYPNSSSTVVTDPLNSGRTYTLLTQNQTKLVTAQSQPAGAGCTASSQQVTYDALRNTAQESKDFNNNRTCFRYDSRNLEILRAEASPVRVRAPPTSTVRLLRQDRA